VTKALLAFCHENVPRSYVLTVTTETSSVQRCPKSTSSITSSDQSSNTNLLPITSPDTTPCHPPPPPPAPSSNSATSSSSCSSSLVPTPWASPTVSARESVPLESWVATAQQVLCGVWAPSRCVTQRMELVRRSVQSFSGCERMGGAGWGSFVDRMERM